MDKQTDIENATLAWQDDGAPYSPHFEDVYFSRQGGLAETHHVFIDANDLLARWQTLDETPNPGVFTIVELGFGTGLNFLCTWRLWQQSACRRLRLHYISCEKHPLSHAALSKALEQWPELAEWGDILLDTYPDHSAGFHRLPLSIPASHCVHSPPVVLDLYYGDAYDCLQQQANPDASVDAWFLDGFAPNRNPALWSEELLELVARRSAAGGTLSSYSVTGRVVRALKALGFEVEKRHGFGSKRHMLFARWPQTEKALSIRSKASRPGSAVVIGAGLAGASVARALALRGVRVTVLEKADQAASGASGNRQAVVQMRLNRQKNALWQFHVHSYLYALRYYAGLAAMTGNSLQWHASGVLTLDSAYTYTRKEVSDDAYAHYPPSLLQAIDSRKILELCGLDLNNKALLQANGGWLDPRACTLLCLDHPLIELRTNCEAHLMEYSDNKSWRVYDRQHELLEEADAVLVCNSHSARHFEQTKDIPVNPLRGQVSYIEKNNSSHALNIVVCGERYIAPSYQGLHCAGASYIKKVAAHLDESALTEAEHRENLEKLGAVGRQLQIDSAAPLAGRAALRGSSGDHMPIAGPAPHPERGKPPQECDSPSPANDMSVTTLPGLYVNVGHGSHGTVSCPLIAEHLAALICAEHSPLPADLVECIEPARFIRRQHRRQAQRTAGRMKNQAPK